MENLNNKINNIEDDEEDFCYESYGNNNNNSEKKEIYEFIDSLEEIVIEDQFSKIRNKFFEKHYKKFDETKEENSLETYDIFKEYTSILDNYLVKELNKRIKNLDMEKVMKYLIDNKDKEILNEELLEMLLSFSDFNVFKEMMIDFKISKESNLNMNIDVNNISNDCLGNFSNSNNKGNIDLV